MASTPPMRNKFAYTAGLIGMAAVALWLAVRRDESAMQSSDSWEPRPGEIDEDAEAELIAMYRPAIDRALT